jgi:hypothetical protein
MTHTKWFLHRDRPFEVRDRRVMTRLEIWIYEDGRPLACHSTLARGEAARALASGRDLLGQAMERAVEEIVSGRFPIGAASPSLIAAE